MTKSFTLNCDNVELMDYPRSGKNEILAIMILPKAEVKAVSTKAAKK